MKNEMERPCSLYERPGGFDKRLLSNEYLQAAYNQIQRELATNPPDAIAILSGSVAYDAQLQQYRPTSYNFSADPTRNTTGIGGGLARIEAAYDLARQRPTVPVVTLSTTTRDNPTNIADSTLYMAELRKLGVTNNVIEGPDSYDTVTEMLEIFNLATEHQWGNVVTLTNYFHQDRAQTMASTILAGFQSLERNHQSDDLSYVAHYFVNMLHHLNNMPQRVREAYVRYTDKIMELAAKSYQLATVRTTVYSAEHILAGRAQTDPWHHAALHALASPKGHEQLKRNLQGVYDWQNLRYLKPKS